MISKYYISLLTFCLSFSLSAQVSNSKYSLAHIVSYLNQEYEVVLSYDASLILDKSEKYNLPDKENNLSEALKEIFAGADISYRIVDDGKILIRKNDNNQVEHKISGSIYDQTTKQPLPYASVFIDGTTIGTITDNFGQFELPVNSTDTIEIHYLGYQKQKYTLHNIPDKIFLPPSSAVIDEVNIVIHPAIYQSAKTQNISFDAKTFMQVGAVDVYGKDLLRSLQMLPGIDAGSDNGGKLSIRGSQPDEVLIVIDGIPLYKTDHYYGIFGAINGEYIAHTALHKNNIPIQEDSRTAGMVIFTSQDDITETSGMLDADFMKISSYLEGQVNDKVEFTLGGRYNHTDPFATPLAKSLPLPDIEKSFIDKQSFMRKKNEAILPNFNFYDFNAKLNVDLTSDTKLQIAGITTEDAFNRFYSDTIRHIVNQVPIGSSDYLNEVEEWNNRGLSLQLSHRIAARKQMTTNVYYSSYQRLSSLENQIRTKNRVNTNLFYNYFTQTRNSVSSIGITTQFVSRENFQLGFNYIHRKNDISIIERGIKKINQLTPERIDNTPLFLAQTSNELNIFGEKTYAISTNLSITGGLKTNYQDNLDQITLSPRLSLLLRSSNHFIWKAAIARQYQNIRNLSYENRFGEVQDYFVLTDDRILPRVSTTRLFPQGVSTNYMIGARWTWHNFLIDVEAYQKQLDGALGFFPITPGIASDNNVPDRNSLFNIFVGQASTRGVDFMLSYNGPTIYSQLAYTYSKTTNTFDKLNLGEEYPAPNDRRHQLKWANSYSNGNLTLGCNTIFTSGEPILSFDKLREQRSRREIDLNEAFTTLPNYIRWDISAEYIFHFKGSKPFIRGSIYNLFNRSNVRSIQQTSALPSDTNKQVENIVIGFETPLIRRLFNLSIGLRF